MNNHKPNSFIHNAILKALLSSKLTEDLAKRHFWGITHPITQEFAHQIYQSVMPIPNKIHGEVPTPPEKLPQFKTKDEILIRLKSDIANKWSYAVFSHYEEESIVVSGGLKYNVFKSDILPFKGNEDLVGTALNPVPQYTIDEGTFIMVSNRPTDMNSWRIGKLLQYGNDKVKVQVTNNNSEWFNFFVPFSEFSPYDVEHTKKRIYRVKNGIVRKAFMD